MRPFLRWSPAVLGSLLGLGAIFWIAALAPDPPPPEPVPIVANSRMRILPGEDSEPWTMLLLADVQHGFAYLPEILRRGAAFEPRAVVVLGDFSADADPEHLQLPIREIARGKPIAPFFIVPGNHDIKKPEGEAAFVRWFGSLTFDVRIGRTRLLGENNANGPPDAEALDALRRKLEESRAKDERVLLCLHRDIIDRKGEREGVEDRYRDLLDLIRRYRVRMVLMGHAHRPHDETRDGVRYVIAPASGDTSRDTPGIPVSFLVLRWDGAEFTLREEAFPRTSMTELAGTFLHLSLAHVRPFRDAFPVLYYGILVLGALACPAGWILWARLNRKPAAFTKNSSPPA